MLRWTTSKLQNILIAYWVIVPVLFYIYLAITSFSQQVSMQDMLQSVPGIALGNLLVSLMLFQAGILFFVSRFSQSKSGLLGKFTLFSIFQQLLTGNFIGAALAFFLGRSLLPTEENTTSQAKLIFYMALGFVLLFSALTAFVAWRMRGV